ncbi:MAG TPA: hypothetical protein DDW84_05830 [Phycisphaerales bacterium]|nr:MAG: hypothetical protein A2Y13_10685 [Planctomycetes bacterium GWC2_45_44]HBG78352.1 hypothetical protein [Phycisphaerales bacterium]HBR19924.1 hypothetical protein [Phycisphaerales bacterium]
MRFSGRTKRRNSFKKILIGSFYDVFLDDTFYFFHSCSPTFRVVRCFAAVSGTPFVVVAAATGENYNTVQKPNKYNFMNFR